MHRAAAAGVPMYILSNMALESWCWIKANVACFGLCKGIVVSGEVQLIKPDPEIYHYLCKQYALQPEECVFIDDMQENIDAAIACGWQGEHLADKSKGGVLIDKLVAEITT